MKVRTNKITRKQHDLIKEEVRKAIVEEDIKYAKAYDAAVLWAIHVEHGHGKQRLERLFDRFFKQREEIRERYLADADDDAFICQKALLGIGVDIDKLYAQKEIEKSRK